MSGLRRLFAASAMTTVVRAIIGQGQVMGDHLTDRLAERAKHGIEVGVRRIVLYLVAGILFAVAGGFMIAAGFMGLTMLVTPPLAALIVAIILALAGGATLLFGRLDQDEEAEPGAKSAHGAADPADPPGETPGPSADRPADGDTPSLAPLLMGILDSVLKYAGRNIGVIAAVLFLIALWFGLGADAEDEDEEDGDDEGQQAGDEAQHPEPATTGA